MKRLFSIFLVLWIMQGVAQADVYRDSASVLLHMVWSDSALIAQQEKQILQLADSLPDQQWTDIASGFVRSPEFKTLKQDIFEPVLRQYLTQAEVNELLDWYRVGKTLADGGAYFLQSEPYRKFEYAIEKAGSQTYLKNLQVAGAWTLFLRRHYPQIAQLINDSLPAFVTRLAPRDTIPAKPTPPSMQRVPLSAYQQKTPSSVKVALPPAHQQMPNFAGRHVSLLPGIYRLGDVIGYRAYSSIVPDPEEPSFYVVPKQDAKYHGVVQKIKDDTIAVIHIYKKGDPDKHLYAIRNMKAEIGAKSYIGKQTDFYPSGKVKEERVYSKQGGLRSIVVKDTLGNIIKSIERKGNTRIEKQYHTNGQLRLERVTVAGDTQTKYFTKEGRQISYLEGNLFAFDDGVYVISGQKPAFPGGEEAMQQYIRANTRPRGVEGITVLCSVHVKADGTIGEVRVKNSSGIDEVDAEAVRVLKSMPQWNPGEVKKWKFVQNAKDATYQRIKTMFNISVDFDK